MITVILPGPLLRLFPDAVARVDVQATDVGIMLDQLDIMYPGIKNCLVDTTPSIRKHINIFVAGLRADLQTEIPNDSNVYVFTAMSGG